MKAEEQTWVLPKRICHSGWLPSAFPLKHQPRNQWAKEEQKKPTEPFDSKFLGLDSTEPRLHVQALGAGISDLLHVDQPPESIRQPNQFYFLRAFPRSFFCELFPKLAGAEIRRSDARPPRRDRGSAPSLFQVSGYLYRRWLYGAWKACKSKAEWPGLASDRLLSWGLVREPTCIILERSPTLTHTHFEVQAQHLLPCLDGRRNKSCMAHGAFSADVVG